MKRSICLLLILCFMFTLTACSGRNRKEEEEPSTTAEETTVQTPVIERNITLGYYSEKTLNPFTTDSPTNRNITTLIYDPLYILDKSYSPVPVIAQSSQYGENSVTVTIKSGLTFSSGVALTPSDVVYSFNYAKQSVFYGPRLQNILSAVAISDGVVFTLSHNDCYCESVLTFPIVQSGTAEGEFPVGSGRYVIQQDPDGRILKASDGTARNEELACDIIRLSPITSDAGELYLLQTGDLSYFFDDLSDGEYTKIGASMIPTSLNNLVFLGFNSGSPVISDTYVRNAINLTVDAKALSDSVFGGMSRYASTPFNPDWYVLSSLSFDSPPVSVVQAQQSLEEGGYIFAYENNTYRSKDFDYLVLRLIVNEESPKKVQCARLIHDALEHIGIDVQLDILSHSEYIGALEKGEYDLYVGEVRLSGNMDLSCFFTEGGAVSYGIDTASTVAASYMDFKAGTTDISTFVQVFNLERPFIPICYRDGMAYFSREISFAGEITEYEPFLNAYSWQLVS